MQVDDAVGHGRVFCPVPTCPCSDPARAAGWTNDTTMRTHIDAHLAGSLAGEVPADWLLARGRRRCPVCGLSVSTRFGVHPTCRPEARAAAVGGNNSSSVDGLPSLEAIQSGCNRTLRHVPAAARHTWSQVLTRTLAAVAHHNNESTWKELLMLPQCVLCPPPRGGRRHHKAAAAFTLDRLHRWQEGERLQLWDSRPQTRPAAHEPPTPDERRDLATCLGREGFDKKACAALLSAGLCPDTDETRLYKPYTRLPHHLAPSLSKNCHWHQSWRLTLWLGPSAPSHLKQPQDRLGFEFNTFGMPMLLVAEKASSHSSRLWLTFWHKDRCRHRLHPSLLELRWWHSLNQAAGCAPSQLEKSCGD